MSVRATTQAWAWIAAGKAQTAAEKLVLLRLADHVCDETKEAFPSSRHLARMTGLGRATVQRSIKSLDGRTFSAERRKSRYGDDAVTLYHWLLDGWPQDEATPTTEAGEKEEGSGPMVRPGVASPSSQGGLTQQPEPSLNHQTKPPQPVVVDALKNKTLDPIILWPGNLAGHHQQIMATMQDGLIHHGARQAFVNELSEALASGKIRKTVGAYAAGMVGRGWQPSAATLAESRNEEIQNQIDAIRQAVANSATLLIDGEAVELDGKVVRFVDGCEPLGAVIKRRARIEVCHA